MSKSDYFENAWLKLLLQNIAIGGIGDTGGLLPSAAAGSLFLSLHSASPGEAGSPATNEIGYTGYARVAIPRTSSDWSVVGNLGSNLNEISFANCAGNPTSAYYFGLCTAITGGNLLYSNSLDTTPLVINVNSFPRFVVGALQVTED